LRGDCARRRIRTEKIGVPFVHVITSSKLRTIGSHTERNDTGDFLSVLTHGLRARLHRAE
jgi:hypothetical protein